MSTIRVLCPLRLSLRDEEAANVAVANVAAASSTSSDVATSWSKRRCKNYVVVNALELAEISCDGVQRRLCVRVNVRVPWTPTLFVAVRPNYIGRLRRDINLRLLVRSGGSCSTGGESMDCFVQQDRVGVRATKHSIVRALIRSSDQVLWRERNDMSLYELTFSSFRERALAHDYLKTNAFARADDFALFAASDQLAFEIALASYVRTPSFRHRRENATTSKEERCVSTDDDYDDGYSEFDDVDDATMVGGANRRGIDLANVFEMFAWCSVDVHRGNRMVKLTSAEIAANGLPSNPLTVLPIVSYDIETIAENMNAVPRGVRRHHRLSSISLTVHDNVTSDDVSSVTLAYAPVKDEDTLLGHEKRLQEAMRAVEGPDHTIYLYRSERQLLFDAVKTLRNNSLLAELYGLDDANDAKRLACVLVGYNSWEYDYAFLYCRLHYYNLHEHALAVQMLRREARFCPSQISFDLMKHVAARYQTQVGSLALANVARYFGAIEASERTLSERQRRLKMDFDSISIRRLYYDTDRHNAVVGDGGNNERFDEKTAFESLDPDRGLNMLRVLRYNIRDCIAVYYLIRNLAFFDMVALYARHFMVPLVDASYVGNSKLLPNAFALRSLCENRTVLPYKRNDTAMFCIRRAVGCATSTTALMTLDTTVVRRDRPAELVQLVATPDPIVSDSVERVDPSTARMLADQARITNERALVRVNDKAYIGGVNSAESGHYEYPVAVDFASFYPSIGRQFGLSMETTMVLTVQQFLLNFGRFSDIDRAIEYGLLRVFEYEPPALVDFSRDRGDPPDDTDSIDLVELVWTTIDRDIRRYRDESVALPAAAVRVKYDNGDRVIRGRDDMAVGTLEKNDGWYEGVEFSNAREIVDSSVDVRRRRVLIVYRSRPDYVPVISGLWTHYLTMRKRYKTRAKETKDRVKALHRQQRSTTMTTNCNAALSSTVAAVTAQIRVYECMEKMFKVIANSLYGYLNYERSVVYAPTVAAAVTLLSRKTFHETTWICETLFPRTMSSDLGVKSCEVVYRDTDGLILHPLGDDVRSNQKRYENEMVRLINETMTRYGNDSIVIELDDLGLRLCSIMGKKKYWKVSSNGGETTDDDTSATSTWTFVTKGFEKNAQPYVKRVVRTLQRNVLRYVELCRDDERIIHDATTHENSGAFRLIVRNVETFFCAIFSSLLDYETTHGVESFAFGVKLNPRSTDGAESRFIQQTLTRYNFAIGDRAKCLFVLDEKDPRSTRFKLVRDFVGSIDQVNYYKLIRRIAVYLLQTVEGFKRSETTDGKLRMTATCFDKVLYEAYNRWLLDPEEFAREYRALLYNVEDGDNDARTSRRDKLLRDLARSKLLRFERR